MPETTTELAEAGYTEAIKLMSVGNLSSVKLWRPEAFDRFRDAVVGGGPSAQWMDRFNRDLKEELDQSYTVGYIMPESPLYPADTTLLLDNKPAAVVEVTHVVGERTLTLTFIIRPDLDQAVHPLRRVRFF